MSAAKYPRRAIALGPPFDDGTVPEPKPRRRMKQASPSNGAWPPTSEAMPHRPTSRTPDDTAQDNDARAAIEAGTHEPAVDDFGNQYLARLPDAAELDRLRRERDEAQMEYADCLHELDRLRAALIHIADCPPSADPGQFIRHLQAAARLALRSALAPEGSAGT